MTFTLLLSLLGACVHTPPVLTPPVEVEPPGAELPNGLCEAIYGALLDVDHKTLHFVTVESPLSEAEGPRLIGTPSAVADWSNTQDLLPVLASAQEKLACRPPGEIQRSDWEAFHGNYCHGTSPWWFLSALQIHTSAEQAFVELRFFVGGSEGRKLIVVYEMVLERQSEQWISLGMEPIVTACHVNFGDCP